jgi:mono/diheme cytochrome c family protein
MTRSAFAIGFVLAAFPVCAQQPADNLNDIQRHGRQVARTYGPPLSKDTAGGNDEVIRGVISEGTPRMPAFKHYLERPEIDAIIAYLKTVPTPPPAPASATR